MTGFKTIRHSIDDEKKMRISVQCAEDGEETPDACDGVGSNHCG